jgi:predicted O-methyltransferase YrrM
VIARGPSSIRRGVQAWRERIGFARLRRVPCDPGELTQSVTETDIQATFRSDLIEKEWRDVEQQIAPLQISDRADSVNPGDRRAIYYVVRHFKPRSVLEIGTHLGGSTVHIAAGLSKTHEDDPRATFALTTVDIRDVNDRVTSPWLNHGSKYAPAEMAQRLGLEEQISFVTSNSLDYLASSSERYDLIFLDGDHAPSAVYSEVPAALSRLRSGGVILLHDYFPAGKPLWSDGKVIQGPWLAVERLRSEGASLKAIPLGELPWPTKLGSRKTSLALLVREGAS